MWTWTSLYAWGSPVEQRPGRQCLASSGWPCTGRVHVRRLVVHMGNYLNGARRFGMRLHAGS